MRPIRPMLAVSGDPFSSEDWIFEPKIDGTRCIAHISNGRVELQNRRLRWITPRYPEIADSLARGAENCVLDGEIAVFKEGLPDFSALASREHQTNDLRIEYLSKTMPATYVVFDVLVAQGEWVMDRPLIERKEILKERLKESDLVTITDYLPQRGEAYFQAALRLGLEGIMAKRKSSRYLPGTRSSDWIKIKKSLSADLVVGGCIPGKGHRVPTFGGLLLGAYDSEGELIYVGRVGSGFSQAELEEIAQGFQPSPKSPFAQPPSPPPSGVKWVEPELVVEVEALELTPDRHLRAPIFLRVREDKPAEECSIDQLD
jgi:DNA ligase D-like protein (predicted ligase)